MKSFQILFERQKRHFATGATRSDAWRLSVPGFRIAKLNVKSEKKETSQVPALMTNETSYQALWKKVRASLCKCPVKQDGK
jgi:hypothetical protein